MESNPEEILKAFWDAVGNDYTLNDFADGVDITFSVDGVDYTINTKVTTNPRTMPVSKYLFLLQEVVARKVLNGN